MTDTADLVKRSVTRGDLPQQPSMGAPLTVLLGPTSWGGLLANVKGATGLPLRTAGSKERDGILSNTPLVDGMWASALNIAITKQAALGFRIEDQEDSQRRTDNAQSLLLNFDGNYVHGLGRHLHDFLTTDNGAFVEVVRSSSAAGSRVLGLMHLDSLRCWRTGDPAKPVVYLDMLGRYHWLDEEDVLCFVDMPSPRVELRGVGLCAASRAFEAILKLTAIETYFREKVSGARNLAIHIVTGLSTQQLQDALADGADQQVQRGYVLYRGSTILGTINPNSPPALVTIPLAEVPDGFDVAVERDAALLIYANAIGIALQELKPLSGQGLGTGTQSVILDEAAEGRGIAAWRRDWTHQISHRVLPKATTFYLAMNDIRDKKALAEVAKLRAETRKLRIEAGEISAAESRQLALDDGDLPPELAQADATAGGAIGDTDKPLEAMLARVLPTVPAGAAPKPQMGQRPAETPTLKAEKLTTIDDLLGDVEVVRQAARLVREVQRG